MVFSVCYVLVALLSIPIGIKHNRLGIGEKLDGKLQLVIIAPRFLVLPLDFALRGLEEVLDAFEKMIK